MGNLVFGDFLARYFVAGCVKGAERAAAGDGDALVVLAISTEVKILAKRGPFAFRRGEPEFKGCFASAGIVRGSFAPNFCEKLKGM